MTDNDIVKALECCANATNACDNCSIISKLKDDCKCCTYISTNALDLINRLQAELKSNKKIIRLADMTIETANAEIERLKKGWKADVILTANVKVEAYKEFAELSIKRICEEVSAPTPSESYIVEKCNKTIYNLLKELVGEENAGSN